MSEGIGVLAGIPGSRVRDHADVLVVNSDVAQELAIDDTKKNESAGD